MVYAIYAISLSRSTAKIAVRRWLKRSAPMRLPTLDNLRNLFLTPTQSSTACLVFPIHLLRVANDLVIAGPRPSAHGPPLGNRHRPAVAREGGAFNANGPR